MKLTPPKPFLETEKARIESLKRIRDAENAERKRIESENLWRDLEKENWVNDALEHLEAIRAQQELHRLQNEIRYEVVITDVTDADV